MLLQMAFWTEKFSGVSRNAHQVPETSHSPPRSCSKPDSSASVSFGTIALDFTSKWRNNWERKVSKYFRFQKKFPFLLQIFCTGKTLPEVKVIRAIDNWKKRQHRRETARRFWPSDRNVADHFGWISSLFGMPRLDRLRYSGFIYDKELIFFWNVILSLVSWEN